MQLFTALLSVLALAASTTTASPIVALSNPPPLPWPPAVIFLSDLADQTVEQGSSQTILWQVDEGILTGDAAHGQLFLGNNLNETLSEIMSHEPLLPNDILFTSQDGSVTFTVPNVPSEHSYFLIFSAGYGPIGDTIRQPPYRGRNFTIGTPPAS